MESFLVAVARRAADGTALATLPCCVVVTIGASYRDPTAEARARALVETLNAYGSGNGSVRACWASRYQPTTSKPATLTKLMAVHEAQAAVVLDANGTHMKTSDGTEFKLHGGLGVLRVRSVMSGANDTLASICALRAGDTFVDGTAGQCQDALVAAAAVGPTGRVIALEASPLLWSVTAGRPVCTSDDEIDRLLNERIEVRLGEAITLLAQMADGSADVVYFDPMFAMPAKASASFEILRSFAHHVPLSLDTIMQARRVARRCVVVMDQPGGSELERLGMRVVSQGQRKRFGVLEPLSSQPHGGHGADAC